MLKLKLKNERNGKDHFLCQGRESTEGEGESKQR